jgi:hypothetical protein
VGISDDAAEGITEGEALGSVLGLNVVGIVSKTLVGSRVGETVGAGVGTPNTDGVLTVGPKLGGIEAELRTAREICRLTDFTGTTLPLPHTEEASNEKRESDFADREERGFFEGNSVGEVGAADAKLLLPK